MGHRWAAQIQEYVGALLQRSHSNCVSVAQVSECKSHSNCVSVAQVSECMSFVLVSTESGISFVWCRRMKWNDCNIMCVERCVCVCVCVCV